jgi:hypothetical protein
MLSGSGCQSLDSMDARDGEMTLERHVDGPIDDSLNVKERCKHDMLPGSCAFLPCPVGVNEGFRPPLQGLGLLAPGRGLSPSRGVGAGADRSGGVCPGPCSSGTVARSGSPQQVRLRGAACSRALAPS